MPNSFGQWGKHTRPDVQLFNVPAAAAHDDVSMTTLESSLESDDLEELVSGLIDDPFNSMLMPGDDDAVMSQPPPEAASAAAPPPPAGTSQRVDVLPASANATMAPATTTADATPGAGDDEFTWHDSDACLLAQDANGNPIDEAELPADAASGRPHVSARFHQPLLYWREKQRWMWHKKWALPTLTVSVSGLAETAPGEERYVMVSAGTLREDSRRLHDDGIGGDAQKPLLGGEVTFSRLLFQRTSFNTGNRPFHLVVTVLSAPASASAAAVAAAAAGDAAATAAAASSPVKIVPLAVLCSCAIHVDARKRTKGERPEAAADDVRLVQRQRQQVPTQAGYGYLTPAAATNAYEAAIQVGPTPIFSMGGMAMLSSTMLDAMGDGLLELRADGTIVQLISSKAYGYTEAQLLGRSLFSICHPDEKQALSQTIEALLAMATGQWGQRGKLPGAPLPPTQSVRVLHRMVYGLGEESGGRTPEAVVSDSILSAVDRGAALPPQTIMLCSRTALPVGSLSTTGDSMAFSFRVYPTT